MIFFRAFKKQERKDLSVPLAHLHKVPISYNHGLPTATGAWLFIILRHTSYKENPMGFSYAARSMLMCVVLYTFVDHLRRAWQTSKNAGIWNIIVI